MLIIKNSILPTKGFAAINLFTLLFVRKEATVNTVLINHESIHSAQMKEMLFIPFYLWYVIEWLVWLVKFRNSHLAYRRISFEREAYCHQYNPHYLKKRKLWAWWGFLTMKRKK
ncbi:MAG: hypothetical protein UH071_06575 [Paludibacteraceae bacterium]|nr:hypothetical protein [Paludibacteraceae bacterium]